MVEYNYHSILYPYSMKIVVIIAHQLIKMVVQHLVAKGIQLIICKIKQGSKEVQIEVKDPALIPIVKKAFQFPTGCTKLCCNALIFESQNKKLTVFRNKKWDIPKTILLSRFMFDIYDVQWIKKIKCLRKLEPYSSQIKESFYIMKAALKNEETIYASEPKIIEEYFTKIIFAKLIFYQYGVQPNQRPYKQTEGKLFKKSDFLGKWESVYVTINFEEGLKCSPQQNKPHNLAIKHIKEIQTEFELYQEKYLIIKLKRTKTKRQFAIPVKYLNMWIPPFMSLLNNPQNEIEKVQTTDKKSQIMNSEMQIKKQEFF